MEVELVVLEGRDKGREIRLPTTLFVIGRSQECHLRLLSRLVSHLHCAVAQWSGRVLLRDLKSTNGTYLNGEPVKGEVIVHDGDALQVGRFAFTFRIPAAAGDSGRHQPSHGNEGGCFLQSPADSAVPALCDQTLRRPAS